MKAQSISNQNNYSPSFGLKFKLSEESIKAAEKATKLSFDEMTTLTLSESEKLMYKRGSLKKQNKLRLWIADKYRKIGESLGFIEKQYNIYTDVD